MPIDVQVRKYKNFRYTVGRDCTSNIMSFRTNVIYLAPLDGASAVSPTRRMVSNFPQKEEMEIILAGTRYVHVTTTHNWKNIDNDRQVKTAGGKVNALGSGFYTYPGNVMDNADGARLATLLQWTNFDAEDENEMFQQLQTVRIVTVSPMYNTRAWGPKILPGANEITAIETKMSSDKTLNFLAIIAPQAKYGEVKETVWLKAEVVNPKVVNPKVVPEGETFPTAVQVNAGIKLAKDVLPMYWLVTDDVRQLTQDEMELYVDKVFGK